MLRGSLALCAAAATLVGMVATADAAEALAPISRSWTHEGIFGTYDRAAAQRGLQVYRQVCAGCHGIRQIAFRNFTALGFSEEEIRALASEYMVTDGPDDFGDMFQREAIPADGFPSPFPNEQAARAANAGAYPVDLSLITKARANGENYLYSLLRGYQAAPAGIEPPSEGLHYNPYFPGGWIAMPPPLLDGVVQYADGTEATVEQMSADLTVFLAWAAEPTLEERKRTGLKVMLFLIVLTGLFYATKRKVWADAH
jgi:ubiquinol-cytochrome c reductase cytochrome c1 subunit